MAKECINRKGYFCANLQEAYNSFKVNYMELKIGFSAFAQLRPRECVLAGASGTHSVHMHHPSKHQVDDGGQLAQVENLNTTDTAQLQSSATLLTLDAILAYAMNAQAQKYSQPTFG